MQSRNSDIIGWLEYPGIRDIDLPVVQRDNSFYMTHDYLGKKNVSGSIFAEQLNSFSPRDENLVLYGHNIKNGTMFGKLYRLTDPGLFRAHPFVYLETPIVREAYIPYAIAFVDDAPESDRYFPIAMLNYSSENELMSYTQQLQERSSVQFPVEVSGEDHLLTLVTCHGASDTERLVLGLRAVRPTEDLSALEQLMQDAI